MISRAIKDLYLRGKVYSTELAASESKTFPEEERVCIRTSIKFITALVPLPNSGFIRSLSALRSLFLRLKCGINAE